MTGAGARVVALPRPARYVAKAQMEFPFVLDGFGERRLAIRLPGLFTGPVLVVDGVDVARADGKAYDVVDDSGRPRKITFKPIFSDAVPMIQIDGGEPKQIVAKLVWHEILWLGLPVGLVTIGGALGGLVGALGLMLNARIFRTREGFARYALTSVVSCSAVVTYLVLATLFHLTIRGPG